VSGATARPVVEHKSYLAFDFSQRRVGVAIGNTLLRQATPLESIDAQGEERFATIGALIARWQPDALVVGVPASANGQAHDNTGRAQRFVRQLRERYRLPVHEVDERFTTAAARADGARDLDAAAAVLILEQFLRHEP
jgi:putative Holliday junction resolvase